MAPAFRPLASQPPRRHPAMVLVATHCHKHTHSARLLGCRVAMAGPSSALARAEIPWGVGRTAGRAAPKLHNPHQPLDVVRAAPHPPPAVAAGREPAPSPRGRLGTLGGLSLTIVNQGLALAGLDGERLGVALFPGPVILQALWHIVPPSAWHSRPKSAKGLQRGSSDPAQCRRETPTPHAWLSMTTPVHEGNGKIVRVYSRYTWILTIATGLLATISVVGFLFYNQRTLVPQTATTTTTIAVTTTTLVISPTSTPPPTTPATTSPTLVFRPSITIVESSPSLALIVGLVAAIGAFLSGIGAVGSWMRRSPN